MSVKPLRVARTLISTTVNGPGRRFVLWLQGCPIRCRGCINPETWDESGGELVSVEDLLDYVRCAPDIEGVTFSGGEPLSQADALLPLARDLKEPGLSVLCYTGYRYEDILEGRIPEARALLEFVDILIDGPYEQAEQTPLLWRGSRNQRVLFLTDRYRHLAPLVAEVGRREVELQVNASGMTMTGIFDMALWQHLKNTLRK